MGSMNKRPRKNKRSLAAKIKLLSSKISKLEKRLSLLEKERENELAAARQKEFEDNYNW